MLTLLIQGFFFQHRQRLGLACQPIEGVVAVVQSGIESQMFAGAIWQESSPLGQWCGQTLDHYGVADLFDVDLGGTTLCFKKKYKVRADIIEYKFKRQDQLWIGEYSGDEVGKGTAQCIITEVPDTIFDVPTLKA